MSFWKWLGLLLAGFFLATLLYGVASLVVMIPHGWMYCVACLAISLAMLFLYAVFVRAFESQPAMDLPLWKAVGDTGLGLGIGLVHIANENATLWSSIAIAIEAGLLLGAAYKWAGTLWLPIGIHWAWNFAQGNIFGFAVSGEKAGESLLQARIEGAGWLTGGAFGAEASVVAVMAGLLLSAWFVYRIYRR